MGNLVAARKSSTLVMYNNSGAPVARYHLEHAWPSRLEIGALTSGASAITLETVTIVTEHVERAPA